MKNKKIISKSQKETKDLAKKIAKNLKEKRVFSLEGELGGGKTTFTQGFAKALGIKVKIKSPTFVIMRKYKLPQKRYGFENLYHLDCYRLKSSKELLDLSWQEIIKDKKNIFLIEWGDKIKTILPKGTICVKFKIEKENIREIKLL